MAPPSHPGQPLGVAWPRADRRVVWSAAAGLGGVAGPPSLVVSPALGWSAGHSCLGVLGLLLCSQREEGAQLTLSLGLVSSAKRFLKKNSSSPD